MRIVKILKKIIPYVIILIILVVSIKTYEGFFSVSMTCACDTGYTSISSAIDSKCYKCSKGTFNNSNLSCSNGGTLSVKYKSCKCSNNKTARCSDGTLFENNKCYNCEPSYTPKMMTSGIYNGTVRCTKDTSTKSASTVIPGLFCPST